MIVYMIASIALVGVYILVTRKLRKSDSASKGHGDTMLFDAKDDIY